MYPYTLFWNIDLYTIFLGVGFLSAIVLYRILADKTKISSKIQNLCLAAGVISMVGGYLFAVLFQGVYNAAETGHFGSGATFYGGLIGGVITFLAAYFIIGRIAFGKGGEHIRGISHVLNIGICCVVIAHAFGRIGCLFAGCCHGYPTEAWYGIWNQHLGCKTVPTQLFESLFLFALGAFLIFLERRGKRKLNLPIYLITYGAWRFVIEFFRADDRGFKFFSALYPSQLTAIIFIIAGIPLLIFALRGKQRKDE